MRFYFHALPLATKSRNAWPREVGVVAAASMRCRRAEAQAAARAATAASST